MWHSITIWSIFSALPPHSFFPLTCDNRMSWHVKLMNCSPTGYTYYCVTADSACHHSGVSPVKRISFSQRPECLIKQLRIVWDLRALSHLFFIPLFRAWEKSIIREGRDARLCVPLLAQENDILQMTITNTRNRVLQFAGFIMITQVHDQKATTGCIDIQRIRHTNTPDSLWI